MVRAKLVIIQSLVSLRGDVQPTLWDQELRSADQVPYRDQQIFNQTPTLFRVRSNEEEETEPQLRWKYRGMCGANLPQTEIQGLESDQNVPASVLHATRADSDEERKRKGKESLSKHT